MNVAASELEIELADQATTQATLLPLGGHPDDPNGETEPGNPGYQQILAGAPFMPLTADRA